MVPHQCHETFDIAAQPGSDDRADATVRKFADIISAKSKHQLVTALRHPLPLMAPTVFANTSGHICGVGAVVEVVTAVRGHEKVPVGGQVVVPTGGQ